MRRIFELLILSFLFIIILKINSRRLSSTITDDSKNSKIKIHSISVNSSLPQDQSFNQNNDRIIEKKVPGRPDLFKYIHLDLKGAPPRANKFYEAFFSFINKLQMGVKGILIEYEDTLPLQGRFANVSFNQ